MLSLVTGVVADINHQGGNPTSLTDVDGKLFFLTPGSDHTTASLWETSPGSHGAVDLASLEEPNSGLPSNTPPFASLGGDVYFMGTSLEEPNSGLPSNTPPFVSLGGDVYFMGTDSGGAQGLFKSDGTAAGTTEVAPLSYAGQNLATAGGKIFFTESSPSGLQLWSSNGTQSGTTEVSSISPQASVIEIVGLGNSVYFSVEDTSSNGLQLWTSDGTAAGTQQLTDFTNGDSLSSLTTLGGKIVFVSGNDTVGDELWTSDGTPSGTTALTHFSDLQMTGGPGNQSPLQNVNGTLYFATYDSNTTSGQIWTSDGTSGGTVPVATRGGTFGLAGDFTAVGNTVYFVGVSYSDMTHGLASQLWSIDGGTAAPVSPNIAWQSMPTDLTALDSSTLLFAADDGSGHGEELWKSDGTASGTTMVRDLNPGPAGSISSGVPYGIPYQSGVSGSTFAVVGGEAYFSADDGSDGQELWKSDGTAAGTTLVDDISPGSAGSSPQYLTDVDGELFFVAQDGSGSSELLMSNGTAAGTSAVQSFTTGQTGSSSPSNLTVSNGTLYFFANDGTDGSQLWKSDGTAAGTTMVTDLEQITPAYGAVGGSGIAGSAGTVFFEANVAGSFVSTLYRTDGTPAGTSAIFAPDVSTGLMTNVTVSGSSLYFLTAYDNASGVGPNLDLWKSDGTSSGTNVVVSIPNGFPDFLTDASDRVFFAVRTFSGSDWGQLWSSDGTPAGTSEVTALSGLVQNPVTLGNDLVFAQPDASGSGASLWVSDGTAGGTVQLKDFQSSGGQSNDGAISSLTAAGGLVYIVAQSGTDTQLWVTNGTVAGTVQLTSASAGGVDPSSLTQMGGTLYFLANDPASGKDALWSSDGTVSGTKVVADLGGSPASYPGGGYPSSDQLVASDRALFIVRAHQSSASGPDLWESDGTASGTTDLGSLPQTPSNLTAAGTTLFFTATDSQGTELWYAKSSTTPTPTPTSKTPGSSSPAPTSTVAPKSTPAPAPTPAPTIIGEQAIFHRKLNKRGKPVGKAVLIGFALEFSRPMSASVLNAADYQLEELQAKRAGRNKLAQSKAVGLDVSYDTSSNTVTVDFAGKHAFAKGGVLAVNTAVASAAGKSLGGNATFAISPGARSITPA
jgi:ELWxxDGT repeat protein